MFPESVVKWLFVGSVGTSTLIILTNLQRNIPQIYILISLSLIVSIVVEFQTKEHVSLTSSRLRCSEKKNTIVAQYGFYSSHLVIEFNFFKLLARLCTSNCRSFIHLCIFFSGLDPSQRQAVEKLISASPCQFDHAALFTILQKHTLQHRMNDSFSCLVCEQEPFHHSSSLTIHNTAHSSHKLSSIIYTKIRKLLKILMKQSS